MSKKTGVFLLFPAASVVAPPLVAIFLSPTPNDREIYLQIGGLIVQLVGICIVGRQILQSLSDHQRETVWKRLIRDSTESLRDSWRRFGNFFGAAEKPVSKVQASSGIAGGASSVMARLTLRYNPVVDPDADPLAMLEARLDAYGKNIAAIDDELNQLRTTVSNQHTQLQESQKRETLARQAATQAISTTISSLAVGSADIQLLAMIFSIVGSVYSTATKHVIKLTIAVLGISS